MTIANLLKILKILIGKDSDPEELKKPFYLKRRYWGIVVIIGGAVAYGHYGLVLGDDFWDALWNNYQVIVNSIEALVSALVVLYGIYIRVRGQMGHVKKLEAKCAPELAESPKNVN